MGDARSAPARCAKAGRRGAACRPYALATEGGRTVSFRDGVRVNLRYVRVSSARRDLERQIDALIATGIPPERIHLTTQPVASERPGVRALIGYARGGELLIVAHPLDRFGRTVRDALELIYELSERGIGMRELVGFIARDRRP